MQWMVYLLEKRVLFTVRYFKIYISRFLSTEPSILSLLANGNFQRNTEKSQFDQSTVPVVDEC